MPSRPKCPASTPVPFCTPLFHLRRAPHPNENCAVDSLGHHPFMRSPLCPKTSRQSLDQLEVPYNPLQPRAPIHTCMNGCSLTARLPAQPLGQLSAPLQQNPVHYHSAPRLPAQPLGRFQLQCSKIQCTSILPQGCQHNLAISLQLFRNIRKQAGALLHLCYRSRSLCHCMLLCRLSRRCCLSRRCRLSRRCCLSRRCRLSRRCSDTRSSTVICCICAAVRQGCNRTTSMSACLTPALCAS